jgi:hypothetical protein
MSNFYGAISFQPTSQQIAQREEKIKEAITYLGDKYLLANNIQKLKEFK